MYVILVNNDHTLIATQKERIMQRSKLIDNLWFLVPVNYKKHNMSDFTVLLEYVLPVSRKYRSEILVASNELYNDHLIYRLPLDTNMTVEAGDIELTLSFLSVELDDTGNSVQRSRKTDSIKIHIYPITAWSDIIPDSALTALDQRIIKTDAQIKALADMSLAASNKADDIKYNDETNELQLMSNGKEIGTKVMLQCKNDSIKDGIPAVDFSDIGQDEDVNVPEFEDNVVEF